MVGVATYALFVIIDTDWFIVTCAATTTLFVVSADTSLFVVGSAANTFFINTTSLFVITYVLCWTDCSGLLSI